MIYSFRMPVVYLGTSGFSYRDWVGPVYPADRPASDRLALYAERFPFLELNATYYRPPEAGQMDRFARRATQAGLSRLVVKLPGELTHRRPETEEALTVRADQLARGLAPLTAAGLLSGVLAQFPYSFHYTPDNRRYLADLAEALATRLNDTRRFVEFRGDDWSRGSVADGLDRFGLTPVHVDLPALPRLPASFVTDGIRPTRTVYLRMHGRNRDRWWTGDNASRYDYRYAEAELETVAEAIATAAADDLVEVVYVAFNNHFRGQAVDNALMLGEMLRRRGVPVDPGDGGSPATPSSTEDSTRSD